MSFDQLNREVEAGLAGRNSGIPMGFNRLNNFIGIRKRLSFLVGGYTGSGKTSLVDDAFVLNPIDWYLSPAGQASGIKLKIVYRSMERSRVYKYAKWVGRKIFMDHGVIIPVPKMLGWTDKMTPDEHDLFSMYGDYLGQIEEIIQMWDGPENPVGVAKDLRKFALSRGRFEELDEYNKIYVPDELNEIVLMVTDHVGLLRPTKDLTTKKAIIDKFSEEMRYARDTYGYTPVMVSQFNRDISNPTRIKNGDVEPMLEDFKDSGSTQEDADVVLALFDPMRYKVPDPTGYDLPKLVDETGSKYYRSLKILKNSYGSDDVRIGLAFFGSLGFFKEMPRKKDITDSDYANILNKQFFLK